MKWHTAAILFLALTVGGCASFRDSFKTQPGQKPPTLPAREYIVGTRFTVSVRVVDGIGQPMCMLPDASNDITCHFTYDWLENSVEMRMSSDYMGLTQPGARAACQKATWTLGGIGGWDLVPACARALLQHRWMLDNERYEPTE